jgi:hypothetical protein
MNWGDVFNSTFVSNFWAEFNGTIGKWIGFSGSGLYAVSGVLIPFFAFMIALAVLGRVLVMIHKITSDSVTDEVDSGESSHGSSFRDA